MARLLLLIPTTSYRVADFMAAAARLDVEVAVGSNQRPVLEQLAGGRTVALDFADLERGAGQVVAFARDHPLAAMKPASSSARITPRLAARATGLSTQG